MGHLLRVYRKDFPLGKLIDSDHMQEFEVLGWRDSPEKLEAQTPYLETRDTEEIKEPEVKAEPKKRGRKVKNANG